MSSGRPQVDWFRVPLKPELLKELNETSDWKGWKQAGGHLLLFIATAVGTVVVWKTLPWYWLIPALFIHGTVQIMLGSGVHELVHERVFKTRKLNRIFLAINGFLTGWNYRFYEFSHKDHHRYTLNQPHDLEVVLPSEEAIQRIKPETRLQSLKRFAQFFFAWTMIGPTLKRHWDFARGSYPHNEEQGGIWSQVWCEKLFSRMTEKEKLSIRNESRYFLIGHGLIALIAILSGYWVVALVIPLGYYFGGALAHATGGPQHTGLTDGVDDFRICCRTYTCNKFFQYLYWNMNYHLEHHMYAAVPCYNLPRLHEEIKDYLPPIPDSLFRTWCEIIHIQTQQRFDPSFQYAPPLPEDLKKNKDLKLAHVEDTSATDYLDLVESAAAESKDLPSGIDLTAEWKIWECDICGFIYDEAQGLPEEGIAPGTRWEDIPDDWRCPDCGVAKSDFTMKEIHRLADSVSAPATVDVGSRDPIVIIGSGLAAYQLVKAFRKVNAKKPVTVITRDQGEFYSKPSLSNALARNKTPDGLVTKSAAEMEKDLNITVKTNQEIVRIDPAAKTVHTAEEPIAYSRLVLATGADPIELPFKGVVSVNDLDDYRRFREQLPDGGRVVIIGAGLIGCEFSNDLIDKGYSVDVIDLANRPLSRLATEDVSLELQQALEARGVKWHLGASVEGVDGGTVTLKDGQVLEADVVLSAVGLKPRIALAEAAGLKTDKGICVNATLQTSEADIYALGDCAEVEGVVRPYIRPIMVASTALAQTLAGTETPVQFPDMPVVVKTPAYPLTVADPSAALTS